MRSVARVARRSATAGRGRSWSRPPRLSAWRCSRRPSATRAAPSSAGLGDLLRGALARARATCSWPWAGRPRSTAASGLLAALGARCRVRPARRSLGELALELAPARALFDGVRAQRAARRRRPALRDRTALRCLFGPQKGLRPEDVEPFDRALARLGWVFGGDVAVRPGAGAAGGIGAALYALGAGARSGADAVIELVGLRRALVRRGPLPDGGGVGRPPERARQDRRPRRCGLHGGRRALRRARRARER